MACCTNNTQGVVSYEGYNQHRNLLLLQYIYIHFILEYDHLQVIQRYGTWATQAVYGDIPIVSSSSYGAGYSYGLQRLSS